MKKPGYITSSVILNGNFDQIPDDCIYGFQIGESGCKESDKIIFGLNGAGELTVLDGELNALEQEKVNRHFKVNESCGDALKLSFHYYRNKYGWVLFLGIKDISDDACFNRTFINYIPFEKLNSPNKELSLIVCNPGSQGTLWFKDWEFQNDWTPND